MRHSPWRRPGLALAAVAVAAVAATAGEDQYAFMPDGGRITLSGLLAGLGDAAAAEVLTRTAAAADWAAWAASRDEGLDPAAIDTFAGYAELNLPLAEDRLAELSGAGLAETLPPDGKDLAISQCQFCHSLFSGYLMHDRDLAGWEGTFKAPFHTEIPMSEVERKTFAAYSALNMPLAYEDVPPELRF